MTAHSEKYMGFTIKVYTHPVAGGYVPFCQVKQHGDQEEEFNLKAGEKLHETAESAVREAADWGRDLVDNLAAVPGRQSWRRALSIPLALKEEQKSRSDAS